jgi:hypothetical protein
LALVGCAGTTADREQNTPEPATAPTPEQAAGVGAPTGDGEPIDSEGQVPFYARFGADEMFDDGGMTVVVFYRPPECIPAEFNLMNFFDMPGEAGPGAMACNPPTVDGTELWAGEPGSGPAPLVATLTGNGDVPIWFVDNDELDAAIADGAITIGEMSELPSLMRGSASAYDELLHPSQSNEVSLVRFTAEGTLEDGRSFLVAADYEGGRGATTITLE